MARFHIRSVALAMTVVAAGMLATTAAPAGAQPSNDTQAGAVTIPSTLPFHYTESTTDATVDAGDSVASSYCLGIGAPAYEHSVWFKAVVPSGFSNGITVDVTGSDYGAGIAVLQDNGGSLSAISCSPGSYSSGGPPPAGTYYIVVFGDGTTSATGGNLDMNVSVTAPAPDVALTINKTGSATKEGGAWISGSVTCTSTDGSGEIFDLSGTVTQRVGRLIIQSFFFSGQSIPCDGVSYPWQAYAPPTNGTFRGGQTITVAAALGCNGGGCNSAYVQAKVKLNRGR